MDAWGKWTKTNDKLILAADGNGEFVTATGLAQGMLHVLVSKPRSKKTDQAVSSFSLLDNTIPIHKK